MPSLDSRPNFRFYIGQLLAKNQPGVEATSPSSIPLIFFFFFFFFFQVKAWNLVFQCSGMHMELEVEVGTYKESENVMEFV